jgi:ceramide glucosyltransferase
VIFGVADHCDPAIATVEKLLREFPQTDLRIVIDRRLHGSSRKVSNLINMMALARYDVLVLSDSDIRVNRDYLHSVVAPLLNPGVGIVTCPYRGRPRAGFWPLLGALFINDWFIPSVRVAAMTGSRAFASGATIAIRRDVLARIGGFRAIANELADDFRLGELTRRLGLRTVFSEVVVETNVTEDSFSALVRRELRWLRTIRALQPLGYVFSFITFGLPVAAIGALVARGSSPALVMLAITAFARIMLHLKTRSATSPKLQLMILPIRDLLSLGLWAWAFLARRVHWREAQYVISRGGSVRRVVTLKSARVIGEEA